MDWGRNTIVDSCCYLRCLAQKEVLFHRERSGLGPLCAVCFLLESAFVNWSFAFQQEKPCAIKTQIVNLRPKKLRNPLYPFSPVFSRLSKQSIRLNVICPPVLL